MKYVLFNSLSNNSRGEEDARNWAKEHLTEEVKFQTVIGLDYKAFFDGLTEEDEVTLCGGDGTINHFINVIYGYNFKNKLYYAKCGSGNDFYRDVAQYEENGRVELTQFIHDLPVITVNGIKKRFINGIGYGIDGDTCLIGDNIRAKDPSAVINYSKIAISLLLATCKDENGKKFGFETRNATVEVDGIKHEYKNVWLSSAMHGRYYGGGMMAAPKQDRLHNDGKCTVTTLSSTGRLKTLLRFPTFSSGKHDGKKFIQSVTGKHVVVTFDKPCALQIDGDVVKDVLTYQVDYED